MHPRATRALARSAERWAGMGFLLLLLVEAAPAELNCRRMPGGCGGKAARRARNRLHAAAATVPGVSMANESRRVERMFPTTTPAPAAVAKTSLRITH